jgi:IS4 transposase
MRLHASYDPVAGRFETLELTSKREGEGFSRVAAEPGSIVVGDRNYARSHELRAVAEDGSWFLVRSGVTSMQLVTSGDGKRLTAQEITDRLGEAQTLDLDVEALEAKPRGSPGPKPPPLPLRLVVLRASPAQTQRERKRIARSRSKQGVTPRADTRAVAHLVLLATNLDRDAWPPARLGALMRLRWQIELGFKTLKTTCHMREPPMNDARLLRCWILANLAAVLIAQIITDDLGDSPPSATTIISQP